MIHSESSARFLARWIVDRYIDPWDQPDAIECGFVDRLADDVRKYGATFALETVRTAQRSLEDWPD